MREKKISWNDEHKKIKSPYFLISVYLVIERERERERVLKGWTKGNKRLMSFITRVPSKRAPHDRILYSSTVIYIYIYNIEFTGLATQRHYQPSNQKLKADTHLPNLP